MKVIMDFDHSELIPVVKGRGVKTFNKWFEELKAELKNMPKVTKIGISHAEGLEITERFQKELAELFPDLEIPLLHTTRSSPLIQVEVRLRSLTVRNKRCFLSAIRLTTNRFCV